MGTPVTKGRERFMTGPYSESLSCAVYRPGSEAVAHEPIAVGDLAPYSSRRVDDRRHMSTGGIESSGDGERGLVACGLAR